MKKINFLASLVALIGLAACGSNANSGEATDINSDSGAQFAVNVEASTVAWTGTKVVGMGMHAGTFGIQSGSFTVKEGQVVGGSFVLDLNNIVCTDTASWMNEELKGKLVGHLKDTSFLFVAEFPTATFEIANVVALDSADANGNSHTVTGNLTLRGETRSISFPAKMEVSETSVHAVGQAVINRLDFGINYDKEKMSLTEKLKATVQNGIVGENVTIDMDLTASAQ
ncbi:MAG: YceI family protein [Bacteroidia bacterium]